MSNTVKALIISAVVAGLGVAAILVLGSSDNKTETQSTQTTETPTITSQPKCVDAKAAATITYTDSGFQPGVSSIKANESIKFVNNSGDILQLQSNPHPVHTDNPELNVGEINNNGGCTVTLTQVGNWGFHNHLNSSNQASVEVK